MCYLLALCSPPERLFHTSKPRHAAHPPEGLFLATSLANFAEFYFHAQAWPSMWGEMLKGRTVDADGRAREAMAGFPLW
jgi:hypothetical protein